MNPKAEKVKILGAGQLSLMLAEAAQKLGLSAFVFSPSPDEPAFKKFKSGIVGSLDEESLLQKFFSDSGPVIFESDFLPFAKLKKFRAAQFVPALNLIEAISDKIEQKNFLKQAEISVPRFEVYDSSSGPKDWVEQIAGQWESGFVLKWARGGYDGKGVWMSEENSGSFVSFIEEGLRRGSRVFAEEKIDFKREISKIGVYSVGGEFKSYPLVISKQTGGICDFAFGPATDFGFSIDVESKIDRCVERLAKNLSLFGVFAVEMFETRAGDFIANEIAPRVHNTGHFSLSTGSTSQFENHLRAILGMPLGETRGNEVFVMKNILGTRDIKGIVSPDDLPRNWHLKWYDKSEMRVGRKMGHINQVGFSPTDVMKLVDEMSAWIQAWIERSK